MKKLMIATIVSLFVIGMAVSSYALTATETTGVTVNVVGYAAWRLISDAPASYRSTTSITFDTVDGLAPNGWYYNSLATLDGNGDPNDNKSDVGIGVRSNVPFDLYVHKVSDTLDGKLGYYVAADSAYNWDGSSSVGVPGEIPGTGFGGTSTWGTIPTAATQIYDSGLVGYPDFSMGISFALVPAGMTTGTYATTITYTIIATL